MSDLKTFGLALNQHMQNQYFFNVWNKTKIEKKNFLKHLNVASHSRSGSHLFSLSTLLICYAICCLFVTCWLNGWLLTCTHVCRGEGMAVCAPSAHRPFYEMLHVHPHARTPRCDIFVCVCETLHLCSRSSWDWFEFRGKFLNLSLPFLADKVKNS